MAEHNKRAASVALTGPVGRSFLNWKRWLPLVIVAVMVVLSWLILLQQARGLSLLKDRVRAENRLRMESSEAHVSDYLEEVYSILLFISQNDDVIAMRARARGFIQKLYDHGWQNHQLTEVYVLQRDFREGQRPFMTFEREPEDESLPRIHTEAREQEEYRVQTEQIQRFAEQPGLRALLSREIPLCVTDARGAQEKGFVYSVPIRAGDRLVGIVAGMIRTRTLQERLRQGHDRRMALLVDEHGGLVLAKDADPAIRQWFQGRLAAEGPAGFFAQAPQGFAVGHWIALWTPTQVLSAGKWWLVLLYDQNEHLEGSVFTGTLGHIALAASLLVAGIALALLVQNLNKRLALEAELLRERKQLEQQVQEVSEREQRRLGHNLHEDLCQRLTGLEAMSTALQKRLNSRDLPEAQVASEISQELKESVACARDLAEELQPVALLQAGLLAALEELARHSGKRGQLTCAVETDGWPEVIPPSPATHLYRIVQEALNNVVAHAHASQVVIRLSAGDGLLALTVTDNGVGVPSGQTRAAGMGLRLMRYRAELLGAELQVRHSPGKGTTVSCVCPRSGVEDNGRP
jgi:signal transduction histidine kinase